eukprot:m.265248 g.265248  ORF g.265248 m.265248 type:complete len:466 (+) comp11060_c0_seq2:337-1734(+)
MYIHQHPRLKQPSSAVLAVRGKISLIHRDVRVPEIEEEHNPLVGAIMPDLVVVAIVKHDDLALFPWPRRFGADADGSAARVLDAGVDSQARVGRSRVWTDVSAWKNNGELGIEKQRLVRDWVAYVENGLDSVRKVLGNVRPDLDIMFEQNCFFPRPNVQSLILCREVKSGESTKCLVFTAHGGGGTLQAAQVDAPRRQILLCRPPRFGFDFGDVRRRRALVNVFPETTTHSKAEKSNGCILAAGLTQGLGKVFDDKEIVREEANGLTKVRESLLAAILELLPPRLVLTQRRMAAFPQGLGKQCRGGGSCCTALRRGPETGAVASIAEEALRDTQRLNTGWDLGHIGVDVGQKRIHALERVDARDRAAPLFQTLAGIIAKAQFKLAKASDIKAEDHRSVVFWCTVRPWHSSEKCGAGNGSNHRSNDDCRARHLHFKEARRRCRPCVHWNWCLSLLAVSASSRWCSQ